MKHKIGKVLAALVFSAGMVGVVPKAHAGGFTMVPASSGLPRESGYTYSVGGPSVTADDPGGMYWVIPVPNNTGLNGGVAWIDFGKCQWCTGIGVATDFAGDLVALTDVVESDPYSSTSQYVTFGSGFVNLFYITYQIYLQHNAWVNGIEYYQY